MTPSLPAESDTINGGSPADTGTIVGSVIGGAAGLGIIIAGLVFWMRRRRQNQRPRSIPLEMTSHYEDDFYGDPYRYSMTTRGNEYGWGNSSNNSSAPAVVTYDTGAEHAGWQHPSSPPPPRVDVPHYRD